MTDAAYRGERIELEVFTLAAEATRACAPPAGQEGVVVLLAGAVTFDGAPATRASVFDARATAVYLPPGTSTRVTATAGAEIAFVTTRGERLAAGGRPFVVEPGDVVVHDRGRPGWQRDVHDVVDDRVPAQRLLVGETFNAPGQWSSFPPHKHDGRNGEPALEEVYYFRFDRPEGFGFQGLYDARGDERAVFLRHGTIVGIPHGYHPVAAAPGCRLYYLWALAGDPRHLAMYEDPAYQELTAR